MLKQEAYLNNKLDVVGRQKAKKQAMAIVIALVWVAGIGAILYKVTKRDRNKVQEVAVFQDGSISEEDMNKTNAASKLCETNLNAFLKAEHILDKAKLVFDPDVDIMENHYEKSYYEYPKKVTIKLSQFITDEILSVQATSETGNKIEAVFVLKDEKWLLDWQHFTSFTRMSFEDYLAEQPTGEHQFNLFYSSKLFGDDRMVTFFSAGTNNVLYSINNRASETFNFNVSDPLRSKIDQAVAKSSKYKKFNHTLTDKEQGLLGTNDPEQTYRIAITFEYIRKNNGKVLTVKSINAIHWLDSYYTKFLTTAQSLTNRR